MLHFRKETGHLGIFEERILKDIANSKGKSIAQVISLLTILHVNQLLRLILTDFLLG